MLRREKDDPAVQASRALLQPKVELTQMLKLTPEEQQRYKTARAGVFAAGAALHADQARSLPGFFMFSIVGMPVGAVVA